MQNGLKGSLKSAWKILGKNDVNQYFISSSFFFPSQIEVKDNGPNERRSSRARLTIHVTPAVVQSQNTPVFEMFDDLPQKITESDPVNFLVTYVFASDADGDEVRYSITGMACVKPKR